MSVAYPHQKFGEYVGADSADWWNVVASSEELARYEGRASRVGEPTPDSVTAIVVRPNAMDHAELSSLLTAATGLEFLGVDVGVVPLLAEGMLPDTLRVLRVSGDKVAKFPRTSVYGDVNRVICGRARFKPAQFPRLRHLDIDADSGVLESIAALEGLVTLNLKRCKDHAILARLRSVGLSFVGFRGWIPADWSALQRFENLSGMWIQEPRKTLDFGDVTKSMQGLEELTVGYCKDIINIGALLELPKLSYVSFFGCGDVGVSGVRPALEEKGVAVAVGGTK